MSSTTVVNMMSIKNIIHHEPQYNRLAWTTPFWPRLRDSLIEDPKLFNHLHLECGICLTDMSIFPHDHTFSPDEGLTTEKKMMSHRARILPCGHMFGNKCLHTMIDEALKDMEDGESPEIACPSCRVVFSPHSDCGHPHSAVEIISVVAVLAPVFTPPLDLTDRETLITYGTGANLHYWAVNLEESANVYDEFVREIPLGDALQRVCDEITERLVQNSKKRWYSEDFAGLKFKLMLQRDIRPRAMEYWEAVEVLEDGEANFDLRLNLD
ncbi:hypothetical protein FOC4_g10010815 [Fusarium odoratissimum]|uniref:RING-type domain-containing protein n=1 Tax=Fusarium oxysporum f. sp. cubense (strain race 4) TaxID=2502994 RepID=N1RPZ5_FUSC4|nr:hypothetical protein FOC4_g10010815 [Fusarium odoratissimum]